MEAKTVIGLMSGTSLDGVDLVCCRFSYDRQWNYQVQATACIPYPTDWKNKLITAFDRPPALLSELDKEYGTYLGRLVAAFISDYKLNPQLISSHGHTIFHKPEEAYTLQIGDGKRMAEITGITVVNDFRKMDVQKGGQGAPLVPIGDRLLFGDYGICLNIGGIANLSFEQDQKRVAYDICPANQVLNSLAQKVGSVYDENGDLASSGQLNQDLLQKLNALEFYQQPGPKSLGREWVRQMFLPVLYQASLPANDMLNTVCHHMAFQIAKATNQLKPTTMLVTGGGAYNAFLMDCIRTQSKHTIAIPEAQLVNFKEAIVFAFLGYLRINDLTNCLASVTGASEDSSCGYIHQP